ncbi:hypothetical protein B9Z55_012530 [Caenorhabditis nigoni]|uniref:Homeobox domain-containing protein n=1 Tax=Caenorhabditis nigoni TaxID=1611254 RepID=A0A2G5TXL3_9PELO|nr:hypothetical protein B9Z55_012530 [Caenorhabditis nigoni]
MSNLERTKENQPSENPLKENQNPEEPATTKSKNSRGIQINKSDWIETQQKISVHFEKEQFMLKQRAETMTGYFGITQTHILRLFFQKRKAVLDAYLAGEISFENFPCQMKILEAEHRKCPHLKSYNQVEGLSKESGVDEKDIFDYFKMRRKMDEKMKASENTSEDPQETSRGIKSPELKDPAPPVQSQVPSPCPDVRLVTQQELKNPALSLPATKVIHCLQQTYGSQNPEDVAPKNEENELQMDNPIFSMAPEPEDPVPAQNNQANRSELDVRSQLRLLDDLYRQITMPTAQEALGTYMAVSPSIQVSNKRKYSTSLDALTDKPSVPSLFAKRANHGSLVAPSTCLPQIMVNEDLCSSPESGANELVAPTLEQKVQRRQKRMNLYNGWFKYTHLPFNYSINYESWTPQQVQQFAIQFLPLDAVLTLMIQKVDGSKMELIRCGDTGLLEQLNAGSNGKFVLEHWNLMKENIEVIWLYRNANEEEGWVA